MASATNLDAGASNAAAFIICVAPMSFDVLRPPRGLLKLACRRANVTLAAQTRQVRRTGQHVLHIAPGAAVLQEIGLNPLGAIDAAKIRRLAHAEVRRKLQHPRARWLLEQAGL